jgi:hypothetical protein
MGSCLPGQLSLLTLRNTLVRNVHMQCLSSEEADEIVEYGWYIDILSQAVRVVIVNGRQECCDRSLSTSTVSS